MAQNLIARALPNQLGPQPDRYVNAVLSEGVWEPGHFEVVEQAAPGMSVRCGSGVAGDMAVVEGAASNSGRYIIQNPDPYVGSGDAELSIGNGDPSDPRVDLVVLRVYDDEMDSSGLTVPRVEVIPGTPASSPSAPAVPDGAIALASILVGVNESGSIENADITDLRDVTNVRGQRVLTLRLTASTTFDKADYPWLRRVRAYAQGAGASGWGSNNTVAGQCSAGTGGPAGGCGIADVDVDDLAASETVTVGTGGVGSAGANGQAGGDSSFGTHCTGAGGPAGSTLVASNGDNMSAGAAGGGGTGDQVIPGGPGGGAARLPTLNTAIGGQGGDSHFGGGAHQGSNGSAGNTPASGYGSGGSGGSARASQSGTAGGNGRDGIVVLELYA